MNETEPAQLSMIATLLLLIVRGLILWLVIPLTLLWWLLTWPILQKRKVSLAQLLGWVDLNLVAAIERSILRPLIRSPLPWTPVKALPDVSHRINWSALF